ncbi:hypothetical protein [Shouchella shacheensis]|nr:hypothetical protein [Shouchella shacheensis]
MNEKQLERELVKDFERKLERSLKEEELKLLAEISRMAAEYERKRIFA